MLFLVSRQFLIFVIGHKIVCFENVFLLTSGNWPLLPKATCCYFSQQRGKQTNKHQKKKNRQTKVTTNPANKLTGRFSHVWQKTFSMYCVIYLLETLRVLFKRVRYLLSGCLVGVVSSWSRSVAPWNRSFNKRVLISEGL